MIQPQSFLPMWDKESNTTGVAPASPQTSEQRGAHGGQHGGHSAGQCGEGLLDQAEIKAVSLWAALL